jgi:dihydrofolate reductase
MMASPRLSFIVAMAKNRVIGRDNALPWKLPEDLRHFKATTLGHPIVMGRKTWESIGRPLPGRQNIVVTRNRGFQAPGAVVVHSLDEALAAATPAEEVFLIGGAQLYVDALPRADRIHLTEIDREFEGDAYFPLLPAFQWREVSREGHVAAAPNDFRFDIVVYEKVIV